MCVKMGGKVDTGVSGDWGGFDKTSSLLYFPTDEKETKIKQHPNILGFFASLKFINTSQTHAPACAGVNICYV